jgi:hypothetical protein
MKRLFVLSLFLFSVSVFGQATVDFDTTGQSFTWTVFANGTGDSSDFGVIPNPNPSGINTSANVVKFKVNTDAAVFAGAFTDNVSFTLTADNSKPSIMFHKDVISDCAFKFEGPGGYAKEVKVPNTLTNQWEKLTFDFTADIGKTVTRIVVFPDFPATRTAGSMNYFDNIEFVPPPSPGATVNFETNGNDWNWILFDGTKANFDVVANPSKVGNTTDSCAMLQITDVTADPWLGVFSPDFPDFTFDANNCFVRIWVYKDHISNVGLKIEPARTTDYNIPNTVINQWEEIVFDYSAYIGMEAKTLVVIPDFAPGPPRTYTSTSYFDEVSFGDVIPVELTSFTASVVGNSIQLRWATATETNNQGFEIQRGINNRDLVTVGFVKGNGTTTETQSYTYVDNTELNGTVYYRLKQLDLNGKYDYSKVVEVTRVVSYGLSQNYPNPFNPTTAITYSIPENSFVTLKVYDVLGSEVADLVNGVVEAGVHKVNFNAFNLNSGVYFYTIKAGNFSETKKLMLMK